MRLAYLKAKRFIQWFVLLFFGLRRINWTKNFLPRVFFEFSDSLIYENTVEHVLVRAYKIHESVLYQAFFWLFFELAKIEDGPEFAFLDSLNLYKKEGKGSSFTCFLHHGSKSCFLEQGTSFESINS